MRRYCCPNSFVHKGNVTPVALLQPADFRAFHVDVAARVVAREYNRRLRPYALTYVPYFILLLLAGGARRPSDLAAALKLDGSSLSGHLERLAQQGRILRRPDPSDRRAMRAELTPLGAALLDELAPLGTALAALEPDVPGTAGADAAAPGTDAVRALAEIHEAVRSVSAAFARVDRAASASVDALGELAARAVSVLPSAPLAPAVLRLATMTAPDSVGGRTLQRFAGLVAERSAGTLQVELDVPATGDGGELQLLLDVRSGRLAIAGVTAAVAGNLVPEAQLLELPYLFGSRAHARRALDGPLGADVVEAIAPHGLLGLGIASNGLRSITSRRRLDDPAGLRGERLRVQQAPVNVYLAEAFGAIAVPLPYERLAAALRAGDVDAQENALPNIVLQRLWETQPYLALTEHVHSSLVLFGNPAFFAALGERRMLVLDALTDAIHAVAQEAEAIDAAALVVLRERMQVTEFDEAGRAAYRAATRLVYDRTARALGAPAVARTLERSGAARTPHVAI